MRKSATRQAKRGRERRLIWRMSSSSGWGLCAQRHTHTHSPTHQRRAKGTSAARQGSNRLTCPASPLTRYSRAAPDYENRRLSQVEPPLQTKPIQSNPYYFVLAQPTSLSSAQSAGLSVLRPVASRYFAINASVSTSSA